MSFTYSLLQKKKFGRTFLKVLFEVKIYLKVYFTLKLSNSLFYIFLNRLYDLLYIYYLTYFSNRNTYIGQPIKFYRIFNSLSLVYLIK